MKTPLQLTIRTPRETILDESVTSLRLPTQTGQVGLRRGAESTVLAVEAGLIILKFGERLRYVGTIGGVLHTSGDTASLLTPMAVVGDNIDSVTQQLEAMLTEPNEEMEVRRTLGRLETRILKELRIHEQNTADLGGKA